MLAAWVPYERLMPLNEWDAIMLWMFKGRAFYLDGFNVKLISYSGEDKVAEFTPQQEGTFAYHCGMNMFRGRMVVTS